VKELGFERDDAIYVEEGEFGGMCGWVTAPLGAMTVVVLVARNEPLTVKLPTAQLKLYKGNPADVWRAES
jgi:hypothetical protein